MELHERVRYIRTELLHGISQNEFADALGVSRDEINNIEGNRLKKPEQKRPLLLLMCSKFNVDEGWLLYGKGDPRPEKSRQEEISELVNEVLHGPDSFKKAVVEMICTRTDDDLKALEKALLAIYDNIPKNGG